MLKFHSVGKRIALAFALTMPIVVYQLGIDAFDSVQRYRDAQVVAGQNAAANNLIAGVYEILMERLARKVNMDFDTARRLFTLICVLHWKG